MDISITEVGQVAVVTIDGDLDGNTAAQAQSQIIPLAQPDCRILLDMTKVGYMSSAGLRLLLITYRTMSSKGGKVVLVGLSDDLKDTMSLTGFLDFFAHYDSVDDGLKALA